MYRPSLLVVCARLMWVSINVTMTVAPTMGWSPGPFTWPVMMSVVDPTCARTTAGTRSAAARRRHPHGADLCRVDCMREYYDLSGVGRWPRAPTGATRHVERRTAERRKETQGQTAGSGIRGPGTAPATTGRTASRRMSGIAVVSFLLSAVLLSTPRRRRASAPGPGRIPPRQRNESGSAIRRTPDSDAALGA